MNTQGASIAIDMWLSAYVDDAWAESQCDAILVKLGVTVVAHARHRFIPAGLTSLWVLAESHCALHTYPEHRYIALDLFTCGHSFDVAEVESVLRVHFPIHELRIVAMKRGDAV